MNVTGEVCALLTQLGIPYLFKEHARVSTIAECAVVEKMMGGCVPRNLFLAPRNLSAHYLLIAHAKSVFRTSSVSKQVGASRLAFAPEADIARILHAHAGAVSPLGLLFDERAETRLLVDKALLGEEYLIFHPCENDASLKLRAEDFFECFLKALRVQPIYVEMEDAR